MSSDVVSHAGWSDS
uniref:Uncharacterized protein n=1 Tax=Anguilla anguilla TaxID=7936 RepID=A0A0E9VRV8_ANGAN